MATKTIVVAKNRVTDTENQALVGAKPVQGWAACRRAASCEPACWLVAKATIIAMARSD